MFLMLFHKERSTSFVVLVISCSKPGREGAESPVRGAVTAPNQEPIQEADLLPSCLKAEMPALKSCADACRLLGGPKRS